MYKGKKLLNVEPPMKVVIMSDGEFSVYGCVKGDVRSILGPVSALHRSCVIHLVEPIDGFMVAAKPSVQWSIKYVPVTDGKEYLDSTPVELPVGYEKPLTLREDMMRFIREEVSAVAASNQAETFEDADDFDVMDDELPDSVYEFAELQDDYVPEEVEVESETKVVDEPDSGDSGGSPDVPGAKEVEEVKEEGKPAVA